MDTEMACICPRAPAQQSCYQRATARSDADALLPTLVEGTFRTRPLFTGLRRLVYTQGDNDVISMPAGFRRHLVGKVKGNVFPYSLPSVGPGADPGVQAVSPQVT